ncbi:hypothetical protein JCM9492_11110 [Aquifex pyrophilus]
MKVEITIRKLPKILKREKVREAVELGLKRGASRYREMVLDWIDEGRAFKRRSGFLRSSVVAFDNKVVAGAEYAPFVEFGTRPHVILPRRKRALRFIKDGKEIFAKRVNHPGSKPYPFMFADMERRKKEVAREFLRAFGEVLND